MIWTRIIWWTAGLALACFVGLSSFVIANGERSPARSLAVGVVPTEFAEGRLALALYRIALSSDPEARVRADWVRMARRSFSVEPLETSSLGLLAAAWSGHGSDDRRMALLRAAGKLNRRDGLVTGQLIQLAAKGGDYNTVFSWMSRTIETDTGSRADYVRAMADATGRPASVGALVPLIGPQPSWTEQYWAAILNRPNSFANAAALRMALTRKPWNQHEIGDSERGLTMALVARGQIDEAHRLAVALGQPIPSLRGDGNLLANSGFTRNPMLPPFDWSLASTGALAASVDTKSEALTISAIGGAQTYAARQLVRVEPGTYRFGWTLISPDAEGALPIFATMRCAEAGTAEGGNPVSVPMTLGKGSTLLRAPEGDCRWYWLAVNVATDDTATGFDATLRDVSLVRSVRESGGTAENDE